MISHQSSHKGVLISTLFMFRPLSTFERLIVTAKAEDVQLACTQINEYFAKLYTCKASDYFVYNGSADNADSTHTKSLFEVQLRLQKSISKPI